MEITDEILNAITEHAELQFLPTQIELILSLPTAMLSIAVEKQSGPLHVAYLTGTLKAEAALRKSIYTMAKSGSSPAQKQFIALIEKREKMQKKRVR